MAGPSVVVRVLGDLKGLGSAVDSATSKGVTGAGKMRSAFSGMLSTLNATGVLGPFSSVLEGVQTGLDQVAEHSGGMGTALMGVGATATGVGVALTALGSSGKRAHESLKQAIENTGKSYADYSKQIDAAAKRNEHFGYTTHTTEDALRILTQATGDPKKALDLLGTATDLAAAKNEDLSTAATQIGKAYNGAGKILKEFHITAAPKAAAAAKKLEAATRSAATADDKAKLARQKLADYLAVYSSKAKHTIADQQHLRDKVLAVADADAKAREAHVKMTAAQALNAKATAGQRDNMAQLAQAVHGQAEVAADSFTGKLKELTAKATDAATNFGEKFGPAITAAGVVLTTLGGAIEGAQSVLGLFKGAQVASTTATEGMTVAQTGAAASSWAMLGPILLVIAAIAALVLVGYVIYRNWKTIWAGMKAATKAVWDWIKKNWPLLLAIIMGPIGLAALAVIKNFDKIKAAAAAVWNWIKHNWPLLVAILMGPVGIAALALVRNFDRIKAAAAAVWHWIASAWPRLLAILRAPFDVALAVISRVLGGLLGAVQRVYSWIRGAWSAIGGWLRAPFDGAARAIRSIFSSLYNWLVGLPGRIAYYFDGLASRLASPFTSAADTIRRAFEDLVRFIEDIPGRIAGTLSSIASHIPGGSLLSHIPGAGKIPFLAEGGTITHSGLAYVHAGESVVPAGAGRSSPSVWIEHVTVAETLDVDAFLRRAAWAVQKERI